MIRTIIIISLTLLTTFSRTEAQEKEEASKQLEIVDSVDIKKYSGLWYEIARIPNSFQDKCAGTVTAEYELREDGRLNVINKCEKKDGSINKVKGIAKITDKNTNAKLKVSFVNLLGINLFWGDYWIIGLDEEYKWAIVGHPERKYGWILCRKSHMTDSTGKKINNILAKKGYNPDRFRQTNQNTGERQNDK